MATTWHLEPNGRIVHHRNPFVAMFLILKFCFDWFFFVTDSDMGRRFETIPLRLTAEHKCKRLLALVGLFTACYLIHFVAVSFYMMLRYFIRGLFT